MFRKLLLCLWLPSAVSALELTYNGDVVENVIKRPSGLLPTHNQDDYYQVTELGGVFDGLPEKGDLIHLKHDLSFYYDGSERIDVIEHHSTGFGDPVVYQQVNGEKIPFVVRIQEVPGLKKDQLLDPFSYLKKQDWGRVRGIQVYGWSDKASWALSEMDLSKCFVNIALFNSRPKSLPALSESLQHLSLTEIPNVMSLDFADAVTNLTFLQFHLMRDSQEASRFIHQNKKLKYLAFLGNELSNFVKFKELNTLVVDAKASVNLSGVEQLRKLERLDIWSREVNNLPQRKMPSLKAVYLGGCSLKMAEMERFEQLNPQAKFEFNRHKNLNELLTGVTKVAISRVSEKRTELFHTVTDLKKIQQLVSLFDTAPYHEEDGGRYYWGNGDWFLEFQRQHAQPVRVYLDYAILRWSAGNHWQEAVIEDAQSKKVLYELLHGRWISSLSQHLGQELDQFICDEFNMTDADLFKKCADETEAFAILTNVPNALQDKNRIDAVCKLFLLFREARVLHHCIQSALGTFLKQADPVLLAEVIDLKLMNTYGGLFFNKLVFGLPPEIIVESGIKSAAFRKLMAVCFYQEYGRLKLGWQSDWSANNQDAFFQFVCAYLKDPEIIPLLDAIKPFEWRKKEDKDTWVMFRGETASFRRDLLRYVIFMMKAEEADQIKALLEFVPTEFRGDLMTRYQKCLLKLSQSATFEDKLTTEIGRVSFGLETFFRNGSWGIRNLKGEVLVPCKYQKIRVVDENTFIAAMHNKFIYLNLKEERLTPPFDEIVDYYYEKVRLLRRGDTFYVPINGEALRLPKLAGYKYEKAINSDRFVVRSDDKDYTGVVDCQGTWIFKPQKGYISSVKNKFFLFTQNGNNTLYTLTGQKIIDCGRHNYRPIVNPENYKLPDGWVDLSFDDMAPILVKEDGTLKVLENISSIVALEEVMVARTGMECGLMDYNGDWLVKPSYMMIYPCGQGIYKGYGVMGEKVLNTKNVEIPKTVDLMNGYFKHGVMAYRDKESGLWGLINSDAEIILKAKFAEAPNIFGNNRIYVSSGTSKGFLIMDFQGNVL